MRVRGDAVRPLVTRTVERNISEQAKQIMFINLANSLFFTNLFGIKNECGTRTMTRDN